MTLKAQKEERDKFIDFYQSGLLLGDVQHNTYTTNSAVVERDLAINNAVANKTSETFELSQTAAKSEIDQYAAIESEAKKEDPGDLFKHTGVDIDDQPKQTKGTDKEQTKKQQTYNTASSFTGGADGYSIKRSNSF